VLASPRDEREFAVEVVDPIGRNAVAAKHLGSWVGQGRAEPSGEAKNSVFGECEHQSFAQQVRSNCSPRGFDDSAGAADAQRCRKKLQSFPAITPKHQIPILSLSLDEQVFHGGSVAMIAVDQCVMTDENAIERHRIVRQPKTATTKMGEVDHESRGCIEAVEPQSFVHRDDIPAGRQVGEDEAGLFEEGANEPQAVHAEGLEYAERREVADIDSDSVNVAFRIDGDVHADEGTIVGDELESVIGADVFPRRQNELHPRRGRHVTIEVFVQEFADRGGIFRGDRLRRDAGISHAVSLRGVR